MIRVGPQPLVRLSSAPEGVRLVLNFNGGDGGGTTPTTPQLVFTSIAGQQLSMHRAVWVDTDGLVYYASPSTPAGVGIYITRTGASEGAPVDIFLPSSQVSEPSWAFTPGQQLWAGANGIVTQAAPTSGRLHRVGQALTTNQMVVTSTPSVSLIGA